MRYYCSRVHSAEPKNTDIHDTDIHDSRTDTGVSVTDIHDSVLSCFFNDFKYLQPYNSYNS